MSATNLIGLDTTQDPQEPRPLGTGPGGECVETKNNTVIRVYPAAHMDGAESTDAPSAEPEVAA